MLFPDSAGITRTAFAAGFPGRSGLSVFLPANSVRLSGTRTPPDGSTVGNLDTFHPDFLLVIWLVYGRKPPFLTVSPDCNFEPVRTYPIVIFGIV